MARRNKRLTDDYDLILSPQKKSSEDLYKIAKKEPVKNGDKYQRKKINYTEENVKETIENFKKVKKIIDEESRVGKVRKKQKKKKKKMNKKLKKFLVVNTVLIILLITLFVLALTLPVFNLKEVYLLEEGDYTIEELSSTVGIEMNKNIFINLFKINTSALSEKYPYIGSLDFKYSFPNKIGIKVNSRSKRYYALNKEDSKYYGVSETGYILESFKDTSMWKDEILVNGITFENNVVLGTKINDFDYEKLVNFEKYYDVIINNIENTKITRVTFENAYMKIYINSSVNVIFRVTDSPQKYNMGVLLLILKDIGDQKGTIDMTKENPTFVKN